MGLGYQRALKIPLNPTVVRAMQRPIDPASDDSQMAEWFQSVARMTVCVGDTVMLLGRDCPMLKDCS